MFFLYSLLYATAILALFIPQYLKRPPELRRKWLREKAGYLPKLSSSIWVHAVSVGETGAAMPLLRRLRTGYPDLPIILSTVTDTGQKVALKKAPEGTRVVYLPFDLGHILKRAVSRTRPRLFITIETEIWPNTFRILADQKVPIIVLNGRISERSEKGYRRISFFMKRVLGFVRAFGMQDRVDAERLERIGVDKSKIMITGNFKFDMERPGRIPPWAEGLRGPLIVAGSTYDGEEELIFEAFRENRDRFPDLRLLIAPRHPERFNEVEDLLRQKGVPLVRCSEIRKNQAVSGAPVMLLDTIGELADVYGIADIVIIGKSFLGHGGQNPLEPAYWSKAIICGTHMENFPFIREFYQEGGAFEVEPPGLAKKIRELLIDPGKAKAAGEKARALYGRNAGAVDRAMEILKPYLS